jgi:hypothetical protein
MPIIKQIRRSLVNPKSVFLNEFIMNVTSQTGEDGIILKIFDVIEEKNRWCVELGALDGKQFSNTFNLLQNNAWNGVLIEGNETRFDALKKTYAGNSRVTLVNRMVCFKTAADSLDFVLRGIHDIPVNFDFISIDIDGNDYYIWDSLVFFRPRLVIIEFNPTIPNDVFFVQDKDFNVNQGSSLLALIELGKNKGYELVGATPFNGIFIVTEEFDKFNISDNSIDAMYTPILDGRIFHGYDGTIYTAGMDRFLWGHGMIAPDALQVLPREQRAYGDHLPQSNRFSGSGRMKE